MYSNASTWAQDIRNINHYQRYGPKYRGQPEEGGEEYLLRLFEYGHDRGFKTGDRLAILSVAFKLNARTWYRIERDIGSTYEGFVQYFHLPFGHPDLQERIRRDVKNRPQGPGKDCALYLNKMRSYFRDVHPPYALEYQLDLCFRNLRPDIANQVRRGGMTTFPLFLGQCEKIVDRRRWSTNRGKSLYQYTQ